MRKIVLFSLFVITSISLVSCKNSEEKKSESEAKKENFNVQITASTAKKDDFALYYTEDNTVNFKGENALWSGIKGGNLEEIIKFELTEEKIPTDIRLDFGLNKEQDSVVIKKVKVSYYGNSYEFIGADFFKYFIDDKQFNSVVDPKLGTLTILKKDGIYKTPYFYPTQLTIDNIKKITTAPKK